MQLFTGSPLALKKQFLEIIKGLKQNPFDKVLVLIPSKHLETRLKTELCQDLPCLAGVNFMSLGALAREINQAAPNPPLPLAETSPLLDFRVRTLLKENDFNDNRNLAICFRNSFRDLINAEVEPETLLLLQEDKDIILEEQREYLKKFVPMYKAFLGIQKEPGKSTYKEFFTAARENAKNNAFLNPFKQIIFYGFYDLTSLQYELIKAIINNYANTQVYFPYEKDNPAYKFAEPLFNACFLPLSKEAGSKYEELKSENNLIKLAAENIFGIEQKSTYGAAIEIIRISGEGEVQAAAKRILQLHKDGIAYKDIALTFRGEGNFSKHILEVFKQNRIPLNCNFTFPLLEKPFAAFIYNLFNLGKSNFSREDVTAVLNSPYFAFRQESWIDLIQKSGAECSINQFEEMLPDDTPDTQAIIDILKEIKAHISNLEKEGSFADLAQKAMGFIKQYTAEEAQEQQKDTFVKINEILTNIAAYSTTGKAAGQGEFLEEFFALLKEATFNYVMAAPDAVAAADIMTLRLQDFRAVIILGLNGGILPLVPQPDPALKEVYRQSLSKKQLRKTLQDIGYLIHTTQNRYLEENLLFYFALSSAQEKAVLTYKTSDETGESMVKSIYITLLLSVLGKKEDDLKGFSRRPAERLKKDIKQEFLTKEEAAGLIALTKPGAKELLFAILAGGDDSFEESYNSLRALASQGELNSFDGIISPEAAKKIYPEQFSPSALQSLFDCPLKYFFSHIVKSQQEIVLRGRLADNKKGDIYHNMLHKFYKYICKNKNFSKISWEETESLFKDFAENEFKDPQYKKIGLYPLLLENIKREIVDNLLKFLQMDLKDIQETSFYPVQFEETKEACLDINGIKLNISARIDRIDKKPSSNEGRAIDYKKKYNSAGFPEAFFKGAFQPPLYLAILNENTENEIFTYATLNFIENIKKTVKSKEISLETFNAFKEQFKEVLAFLHSLTTEGIFPLYQNDRCDNCNFTDICRRHHLQSVKRARKSDCFKKLKEYHERKSEGPTRQKKRR